MNEDPFEKLFLKKVHQSRSDSAQELGKRTQPGSRMSNRTRSAQLVPPAITLVVAYDPTCQGLSAVSEAIVLRIYFFPFFLADLPGLRIMFSGPPSSRMSLSHCSGFIEEKHSCSTHTAPHNVTKPPFRIRMRTQLNCFVSVKQFKAGNS